MRKLKVAQLEKEGIRRGWVRMHENTRANISIGSLIKIKYDTESVRRIMLGSIKDLFVKEGNIAMDEPTRNELGIYEKDIGKELDFDIIKYSWLKAKLASILYYWKHPDFSLNFSTKVAVSLGSLSLIISIIGLIW